MDDWLTDVKNYSGISIIFISMLLIFISGLFFGVTYYVMNQVETAFESTDCVIENNVFVDDCQDLWDLSIYPFLALREILVWFSFFFIFALVIGLLILGYQSGNNPVLMGFLVVIVIVATYLSLYVSNIYRTLIENDLFRTMMLEFTIYNRIMLYFPWFISIISLFSVILSVVNWQKSPRNIPTGELDY